ncbi:peroxidase-related enzyme [Nitratireductor kimnyeongensis]|uniref:Carboxymuconolactone decarboxylase-like protein n=2 Tax=Nitratireductor TaxID=245876 RepID=I5BRU9_9HYPH|nr:MULTISPECIES: peroxidase-related enzyme [Nitratireductor]EIM72301.1 carboxymuconolactone decarboxylase-like protein [Nitratireductor aquibiodomus RA22]QZZ37673.1 peroxidase-related enzyme [Nitratireductor kimnyeongensis]
MSTIIHEFTTKIPGWRPRVKPIKLDEATPEQLDALKVTPSNTKVSDYVLVLANDVETLKVRTPLFNAIMYNRGGMGRAERELSAVGASVVNRCVYCAAVHASRYNQLTKDEQVMEAIFADGEKAELDERQKAIFLFAAKLSKAPSEATEEDMQALRDAGLKDDEILDLILSASLFGWANRLMHTLGDPVVE